MLFLFLFLTWCFVLFVFFCCCFLKLDVVFATQCNLNAVACHTLMSKSTFHQSVRYHQWNYHILRVSNFKIFHNKIELKNIHLEKSKSKFWTSDPTSPLLRCVEAIIFHTNIKCLELSIDIKILLSGRCWGPQSAPVIFQSTLFGACIKCQLKLIFGTNITLENYLSPLHACNTK